MQGTGDIISYFFPYYFNCHAKKAQKSNWGKIYDIFSPLGHAIILLLSQTVYWGENRTRGKLNHIFPAGHNLFLRQYLHILTGGKYRIFSPCAFIFSLLGHAINCSTFTGGVRGKIFFPSVSMFSPCVYVFPCWPCCMVFTLPSFLDSFFDMSLRRNNIIFFPPGQVFFLLVTENL